MWFHVVELPAGNHVSSICILETFLIKYTVGKFCFRYAPKILDRYTSAEGFLFLQDDTILNYWNLLQADKSKLWIGNKASTNMKSLFLVFSGRFLLIVT